MFSLTVCLLGGLGAMTRYFLDVKMSPRLRTERSIISPVYGTPRRQTGQIPDALARAGYRGGSCGARGHALLRPAAGGRRSPHHPYRYFLLTRLGRVYRAHPCGVQHR